MRSNGVRGSFNELAGIQRSNDENRSCACKNCLLALKLIEGIATKDADARSEIVANEIVHWTLHEQEANVRDYGRIQLISQTPGLSQDVESKDTYQLITEFAKVEMKSMPQPLRILVSGGYDHRLGRSFLISILI